MGNDGSKPGGRSDTAVPPKSRIASRRRSDADPSNITAAQLAKTTVGKAQLKVIGQPVLDAAYAGDLPEVERLVDLEPVSLLFTSNHGITALHRAAEAGHSHVVLFLLACDSVDVAAADNAGDTPLHWAALFGHMDACKALVDRGAPISLKNGNGKTPAQRAGSWDHPTVAAYLEGLAVPRSRGEPVLRAALEGDLAGMTFHIGRYPAAVNFRDSKRGRTPLHCCAERGHIDIINFLVHSCEANINARAHLNATPLHEAAWSGHLGACRALVESGAVRTLQDQNGFTPIDDASRGGHAAVAGYLSGATTYEAAREQIHERERLAVIEAAAEEERRKQRKLAPPMLQAATVGDLSRLKKLTSKYPVEAVTYQSRKHGLAVLHIAAQHGHADMVKYLVDELHADMEVATVDGWNAVHYAAAYGRQDVVAALHGRGADLLAVTRAGVTAHGLAVRYRRSECAEQLAGITCSRAKSLLAGEKEEEEAEAAKEEVVEVGTVALEENPTAEGSGM